MSNPESNHEYGLTGDAPVDEEFSLEEILAEYGGSLEQVLLRQAEEAIAREAAAAGENPSAAPPEDPPSPPAPAPEEPGSQAVPPPEDPPAGEPERPPEDLPPEEPEAQSSQEPPPGLPDPPAPISLEEIVGSTVDAVMEAEHTEPIMRHRRGLFSRRPLEETEELHAVPPPEPEPEVEPIGPEEEPWEAGERYRRAWRVRRTSLLPAVLVALAAAAPLAAERYGLILPMWTGDPRFQSILYLAAVAIQILLCRHVFAKGFSMLARGRCVGELLISLSALAAAADCGACLLLPERTAVTPYAAAAGAALLFGQWAAVRESRGMYDTFRAAGMDDPPPYLITDTARGACKQRGSLPGFYTAAMRPDGSALMQTILLPVILAGSFVFAGLTSLGQSRGADFLLNWSITLAAGGGFALPLCWALPWGRLAGHLQKTGCAVAAWAGAERISRRRCMILTDTDLFPPGTVQLNGLKLYAEERGKVLSYAAAMASRAGSGLERLFETLLRGEGLPSEDLAEDFSFYEEGGWSAAIRGESVLMGTASFLRKMEVRLPGDVNLKTGLFLSIDHHLAAVFAVKYHPAENVDFALRMMRRGRITPVLASRDPNIDPELLKRKFHKGVRVEFPGLADRIALSEAEQDRDLPRALLFREGLLPFAETVVGSRKLCKAVRRSTLVSLAGSAAGVLLAFYLLSRQAYDLLNPLSLLLFLLLWTLPVLVISDWAGRY